MSVECRRGVIARGNIGNRVGDDLRRKSNAGQEAQRVTFGTCASVQMVIEEVFQIGPLREVEQVELISKQRLQLNIVGWSPTRGNAR